MLLTLPVPRSVQKRSVQKLRERKRALEGLEFARGCEGSSAPSYLVPKPLAAAQGADRLPQNPEVVAG